MSDVDAMARAICAEQCAFMGEPPCWRLTDDETGEPLPWPPEGCDEPGCMALAEAAAAAIRAMPEPGEVET